jgi:hypothetical protein
MDSIIVCVISAIVKLSKATLTVGAVSSPGRVGVGRRTTPPVVWLRLPRRCDDRTPVPSSGRSLLPGRVGSAAMSRMAVTISFS